MAIDAVVAGDPSSQPRSDNQAKISFDVNDLRSAGIIARLAQWVLDDPEWLFSILRRFWPIPHLPFTSWWMVTRFDDVKEVLAQDQVFEVPFGRKITELNCGPNYLLGMQAGEAYWRQQELVMAAFRLDDVATTVIPKTREFAARTIKRSPGRLDAIQDLVTRIPVMLCQHYYGIAIEDKVKFAQYTIAMSTYMFGATNKPAYRRAALAGAEQVRRIVDQAIAEAKRMPTSGGTVLARLVDMQRNGAADLTDSVIRAILIGMIDGFVPTNTMAGGHILEMLLRKPVFMARAQAAASADDDALLKRCLFEAMRFKPLNPGPFRSCAEDYTIASGTARATLVRRGARVLVGTQSAMFDERRVDEPYAFNPDRPPSNYMLFGYGLHWCVGAFIAEAQIIQTMKPLLLKNGLRRAPGSAGRLELLGAFPEHLFVEFER